MRERSDEALMESYAGGDMAAFETLYARHRGPLYRYLLRQVRDAATANDLYQGTWEKIVKARRRYRASAPFRAWLYRIARNHMMDHFRRQKPVVDVPLDGIEAPTAGPEEQANGDTRSTKLTTAIAQLPPEQKDTLVLKLESGLDLDTIAEVTGVNRETAKSRLRYAVRKLKNAVES